jgi:hypothetical protein
MKKLKKKIARLLRTWPNRLTLRRHRLALPNALGLLNEHGTESLLIDPASINLPFPGRYLIIQRGASGYQYGDLGAGGANYPLGVSSDSPYAVGDVLNVRRFSARPGLEMGIGFAGQTVTIDKLLVAYTGGTVRDVTTLATATNGTYWVVGRAAANLTTSGSLQEVPFVPCEPYQIINTGGTLTFPTSPV